MAATKRKRKGREADPSLRCFIDGIRLVLDMDPLYYPKAPSTAARFAGFGGVGRLRYGEAKRVVGSGS